MGETKYDQYVGMKKEGIPYLNGHLLFEYPTAIVKLGDETAIVSKKPETPKGEYLAVFAKGDSIIFRYTQTQSEIDETNK